MEKLDVISFGRRLLETNDLDPVYVMVHEAKFEPPLLKRWLLSYWCFYHVGTASWCADSPTTFWDRMGTAAGSKEYPRSSERRHFRGANAMAGVEYLRSRGAAYLFRDLETAAAIRGDAADVVEIVKGWKQFGPWIAFKVADMCERLGMMKMKFGTDVILYDSPLKAAGVLWDELNHGLDPEREPGGVGPWAIDHVLGSLMLMKAPPRYERGVNTQEAETILCKWLSYLNGHYDIGEDVDACRRGLLRFARCGISQRLYAAGRRAELWT